MDLVRRQAAPGHTGDNMPNSTREWARREIRSATDNFDWANTHILRVADRYVDDHPEIAQPLALASDMIDELQKMLTSVKNSF